MMIRKDKEILESGDALRQGMLQKIQEKKLELFSLNKVVFDDGIETVMQQNKHYESQLEYQTKHMEYLILKNENIRESIYKAKDEILTHKKVQRDLVVKAYLTNNLLVNLQSENNKTSEKIEKTNQEILNVKEQISENADEYNKISAIPKYQTEIENQERKNREMEKMIENEKNKNSNLIEQFKSRLNFNNSVKNIVLDRMQNLSLLSERDNINNNSNFLRKEIRNSKLIKSKTLSNTQNLSKLNILQFYQI